MNQLDAQFEGLAIGLEQRGEKSAAHIVRLKMAEVERLRSENSRLILTQIERDRLRDEVEELRAALEWYTNAGDYEKSIDCGDRARNALLVNEQQTNQAASDALNRCVGITRTNPDGTVERIDPADFYDTEQKTAKDYASERVFEGTRPINDPTLHELYDVWKGRGKA